MVITPALSVVCSWNRSSEEEVAWMKVLTSFLIASTISFVFAHNLQTPRTEPGARGAIPNPHHHARGEDVLKELAPEIKITEARVPENAELQNLLLNKSKRFSSFTVTT